MPKRRVIIREIDLDKMSKKERSKYKEITFTTLTRSYFEKRVTYFALKGKSYLADQYALYEWPNAMLGRLTNVKLHDRRYIYWLVKYNDVGEMVIRAGLRQPESKLGFATYVEKDNA